MLIDELFKGTNVQDAMKCSSTVIKGLIKIKSSLFILSTHLYEIGEELKQYPNISFQIFRNDIRDGQLEFPYQLKEGISNDRLGYLIWKGKKWLSCWINFEASMGIWEYGSMRVWDMDFESMYSQIFTFE